MNAFLRLLCAIALFAAAVRGADNIDLQATNGVLELGTGRYHLWRGVRVESPGVLLLTCEDLRAAMPPASTNAPAASTNSPQRLETLVATTNVVIEITQVSAAGVTNLIRAFGDQAVYTGTNELVTVTGNARVESAFGPMTADSFVFDLRTRRLTANGSYRGQLRANLLRGLTGTRTNSP
jgi:hypothetical protein